MKKRSPDLVYCSTTDWMMHKYAPDEEQSVRHVQAIDFIVGRILDQNPGREIYLTADPGMSEKTQRVDLRRVLQSRGIGAAKEFELMEERIGDIFALGDKGTVFEEFDALQVPVRVRSHGSCHESPVPIIAYRNRIRVTCQRNMDIVAQLDIID
ncbi:MAG: alkaline phosphatase family protein [Thermodesulfobacteriota bacterium]